MRGERVKTKKKKKKKTPAIFLSLLSAYSQCSGGVQTGFVQGHFRSRVQPFIVGG